MAMLSVPRVLLPLGLGVLAGVGMGLGFPFKAEPSAAPALMVQPSAGPTRNPSSGHLSNSKKPGKSQDVTAASLAAESLSAAAEIMARIAVAEVTDLPGLFEALEKLPGLSVERELAGAAYFQRWVELGPEAGLLWLQQTGRMDSIRELAARWLRSDPPSARAWVQKHPEEMYDLDPQVAGSGSDEELKNILSAVMNGPGSGMELRQLHRTLAEMATRDPAWAMQFFADSAGASKDAENAARAVARGLSATDAKAALAWAKSLPVGKIRDAAMLSALDYGSFSDPATVREMLNGVQLPDKALANTRLRVAIHLAGKNPAEAIGFLKTLAGGSLEDSAMVFQLKCAQGMDLKELHALLSGFSHTGIPTDLLRVRWSGRDLMADAAQLSAMPEGAIRNQMIGQLTKAMTLSAAYPPGDSLAAFPAEVRGIMAGDLFKAAFENGDQDAARKYWDLLPEKDRGSHVQNMVYTYGTPEGKAMVDQWLPELSPGDQQNVRRTIGQFFAESDPSEAMKWVTTLPAEEQAAGAKGVATTLAMEDAIAAADWVNGLASGPVRDAAAAPLVPYLAGVDPESALVWARSIGGEADRLEAMESLGFAVISHDTEAAMEMLENSALGEADQKAFWQGIEKARKYR